MKKTMIALAALFVGALVHAEPTVITGYDMTTKEPCSLTIDEWSFELGEPMDWYGLRLKVHTSYRPHRAPVTIKHSATPFILHGAGNEYDVIAVEFRPNQMTAEGIIDFMFQTWEEGTGLVQAACRISK